MELLKRRKTEVVIVAALVAAVAYWTMWRVNPTERTRYGAACADWMAREFGDGRAAKVSDAWIKRGDLVFEVRVPQKDGGSSSVYLCVVDRANGTMLKPSAFDTSWR